jgi:hypothetical protein
MAACVRCMMLMGDVRCVFVAVSVACLTWCVMFVRAGMGMCACMTLYVWRGYVLR